MLIEFDYQIFVEQEFGGISRYYCALATELRRHAGVTTKIVAPLHINAYLRDRPAVDAAIGYYVKRLPRTGRLIKAASAVVFPTISRALQPDIVHETYYSAYPTDRLSVPRTLTVYDMIHERFPGSFSARDPVSRRKASAVKRADHIFCISENTKRDLVETYDIPESHISVTYLGSDPIPLACTSIDDLFMDRPYLLYVGARGGYKNFSSLLDAYAASAWIKHNFRLVCFGGGPLSIKELKRMKDLGLTRRDVHQIGGGDELLWALYRQAAVFVYPSLYEGFGIPPLEAMSADCPVACSLSSSIPEVVGSAGEYFDPTNTDSIRTALEVVLQSAERRGELVALGRARHAAFSWERCASETLAVYRKLI